jgi:hypothetical protein
MFCIALLILISSAQAQAQTPVCADAQIQKTQECFAELVFPPDGSDREIICKYVEAGMQCFESECCTDHKYAVAISQIQDQGSLAGCTAVLCGAGMRASACSLLSLSVALSLYFGLSI